MSKWYINYDQYHSCRVNFVHSSTVTFVFTVLLRVSSSVNNFASYNNFINDACIIIREGACVKNKNRLQNFQRAQFCKLCITSTCTWYLVTICTSRCFQNISKYRFTCVNSTNLAQK